jgi:hypothetical protein
MDNLKLVRPFLILWGAAIVAALGIWAGGAQASFLNLVMGQVFLALGMLKIFEIEEFVSVFVEYDFLSQHRPEFAWGYPFLEIALGILYFSGFLPLLANFLTITVVAIHVYNTIRCLGAGMEVRCPFMGTLWPVQLGTHSFIYQALVGLAAAVSLFS